MQSPNLQNTEVSFNYHKLTLAQIEGMTIKIKPMTLRKPSLFTSLCPDSNDLESDDISIANLITNITV